MSSSETGVPKKTILIADDDELYLTMLGHMLEECCYEVRMANNGKQAIEIAEKSPPDLFLLDVHMPGMDGYELCRKLKSSDRLEDIPVIFISGLSEAYNKLKGFEAGAVDYINKPFSLEEVESRVRTHMELSSKIKELERMNTAMINREMRVIELKEEVNQLAEELGRKPPYSVVWETEEELEIN